MLVSNAGNQNRKPLIDMDAGEWQQLMKMMSRGFGKVLLMSSVAGQATMMPNLAAYATAKGGLVALARAIAVEYGIYLKWPLSLSFWRPANPATSACDPRRHHPPAGSGLSHTRLMD